ncbi:hypothetical protein DY000_02013607 [Brassica cretica]|uniref:Uncharacterized protein n=1 Tax=Brassica cretica TaxID=69181 RepID=A0ABQ7CRX1_BRACR|nr:hypothetical protein DY000_02013607 [Brassica cretica]
MCGGEANGGGDCSNSFVWFSHSGSRRQGVASFHHRICLPVVETLQRRCDELGHGGSSPPVYIHHSATLKSSLLPFNVRLLSHLCSLFLWVLTSLSSHCGLELSALDYFHNPEVCYPWAIVQSVSDVGFDIVQTWSLLLLVMCLWLWLA